jgi:DNA repair photolyase
MTDERWTGDKRTDAELVDQGAPVLTPCSLEGLALQLDPYLGCQHQCCYCYALTEEAGGWRRGVRGYDGLARRLEGELASLKPQPIYLGWYSDPYQPIEAERGDTRSALRVLAEAGFSGTILTKSDLFARDLDLLATMPGASVGVSVAFADERTRRLFEPAAPPNARRIEALRAAREAGIRTYVLVCPVMPYVTDLSAVLSSVREVADEVSIYRLQVFDTAARNWRNVLEVIRRAFPEIEQRFAEASLAVEHPYWHEQREVARRVSVNVSARVDVHF